MLENSKYDREVFLYERIKNHPSNSDVLVKKKIFTFKPEDSFYCDIYSNILDTFK
jgi:hypothetical protein